MKVAFWSNVRGKNGVTSNLVGISVILAIEGRLRTLLYENHCHISSIGKAFSVQGSDSFLREEEHYYYHHRGMDTLIKEMHAALYSQDMIEKSSESILNKGIYYIPQSRHVHEEVFEHEFYQVIHPFLEQTESFAQISFIDTAGSNNLSTKVILEKAELVVVNLSQEPCIIEHFFENYSNLLSKSIFLLGGYNSNSAFNVTNIRRKYRIPKNQIGVIPYNIGYKDAIGQGCVVSFLSRNYQCEIQDENHYFMKELKNAANMIYRRIFEQEKLSEYQDTDKQQLAKV